jgi:spore maturation protein CgeB
VDEDLYRPQALRWKYDLAYLGTYSPDRQPSLEALLLEPARRLPHRRFLVAGPQYPNDIVWPDNVERQDHVGPQDHSRFYGSTRFALNITRAEMMAAGYSPSVRLFEAAACGTAIITDDWPGLGEFFEPAREIVVASGSEDVVSALAMPAAQRAEIATAGRHRALHAHTARHRAVELETYLNALQPRERRQSLPDEREGIEAGAVTVNEM